MSSKEQISVAAWRTLLEAHAAVVDRLGDEMEAEAGLPLGWYEVLLYLAEAPDGRLRMHELADSLLLSRSAVTRFVDRMQAAELVERVTCASDGRGFEIVMTELGRRTFRRAGRIHLRGIREHFITHVTAREAAVITAALGRVAEAVNESRGGDQAA